MTGPAYYELRPCYTGEAAYSVVITIEGSGSISGQTFVAAMLTPGGATVPGTSTAVVSDAATRKVTVTLPGQAVPGEYPYALRRTDDSSNLVVAHGIVDVQRFGGRGTA